MDQTHTIEQIVHRLEHLEQAMSDLRSSVSELQQQAEPSQKVLAVHSMDDYPWADQALLRQAFNDLLAQLDIHREPVGIEALQKMMAESGLGPNELSQGIMDLREE